MTTEVKGFPSHDIDPADKGKEWILQYARAMWNESSGIGDAAFNGARDRYKLNRLYRMGKQGYDPYEDASYVDENDESYTNIPREVVAFIVEKIDRIKAKILAQDFRAFASPIDQEGAEGTNKYYASIITRLAYRKQLTAAAEAGSQEASVLLQNHPAVQMKEDEPQDEEELEAMIYFGEQFNRSESGEHMIDLALFDNRFPELEDEVIEAIICEGISGYMDGLDINGNPMLEVPNMAHLIVSPCKKKNFSDMRYWGVIEEVSKTDLQIEGMSKEQLLSINNANYPNNSNATVKVLRFKFYSVDGVVWDFNFDKFNNPHMPKADYSKRNSQKKDERAAFVSKKLQNVYQGRWIIGTDYLLDGYGLEKDMPRSQHPSRMSKTKLGLTLYAPSFTVTENGQMVITSLMDRAVPLINNFQRTYDRYLAIKEHWIPSGYSIDTASMDGVMLGKAGKAMTKREIFELFREMGILLYSSKGLELDKATGNYDPIKVKQNSIAADLMAIYQDLVNIKSDIQQVLGDAESNVLAPRTTNDVIAIAANNTGLSLWPIAQARKILAENAANAAYVRVQQTINKNGSYSGNAAVAGGTMKFVYADRKTPLPDMGIRLEWLPTEQDKQMVIQVMAQDIANKLLNSSDVYVIMGRFNLRQALRMLDSKVRRKEKEAKAFALQQQQMNGQVQIESSKAAEEEKRKTLENEINLKSQLVLLEKNLELRNMREKWAAEGATAEQSNTTKTINHALMADAKLDTARINKNMLPESSAQEQLEEPSPAPPLPVEPVTEQIPQEEIM